MNNKIKIIFILLITIYVAKAQNPAPSAFNQKSMLLRGGIAHIGNGTVIENSLIGITKGKIDFVYDATTVKLQPMNYDTVMEIYGKHVYPGLIGMNTNLGLSEIEAARATNDIYETGNINPSSRSAIAYNTDSKIIPTVRSNGILIAQVVPSGGLVSGTSSVMQLDAWNWEDAVIKMDEGLHINWPGMRIFKAWWAPTEEEQKDRMAKGLENIKKLLRESQSYCNEGAHQESNLNLQAMCGLFNGTKKLYIHANYVKEIVAAVNVCKEYKIKMVLVGGADAWLIPQLLKENNIPVIIERTQTLPGREDDDIESSYRLPAMLQAAGVVYCISDAGFWQQRNLPFQAGNAVSYGITKEQALESITLTPAKILGIEEQAGSLEQNKDATLIISDGDILDMKSNNIIAAYINGRKIDLDNIQKQLYLKYCNKYGIKP